MQYGCLVVNAPTANTVAAAEHGIALLAALSRNIAQADASTKSGKWQRGKYVGVALAGKTLAIFGFGKVRFTRMLSGVSAAVAARAQEWCASFVCAGSYSGRGCGQSGHLANHAHHLTSYEDSLAAAQTGRV